MNYVSVVATLLTVTFFQLGPGKVCQDCFTCRSSSRRNVSNPVVWETLEIRTGIRLTVI